METIAYLLWMLLFFGFIVGLGLFVYFDTKRKLMELYNKKEQVMKCVKCKKTLPIRHVIFKGQKRNYIPTLKVDGEGPFCKSCAKFIRYIIKGEVAK